MSMGLTPYVEHESKTYSNLEFSISSSRNKDTPQQQRNFFKAIIYSSCFQPKLSWPMIDNCYLSCNQ